MYIQYRNKENQIYSLDLFELSFSYFLLMFCWLIPKRIYLTKGTYERYRKGGRKSGLFNSMMIVLGMMTSKLVNFNTGILFETNIWGSALLFLIITILIVYILFLYNKKTRRKMLEQIEIIEKDAITVNFKPKTKSTWILFGLMIYFTINVIPTCIDFMIQPTLYSILSVMLFVFFVIEMPLLGIYCCNAVYEGEILKRIIP